MNKKRPEIETFLPKKFWLRIHNLLSCNERSTKSKTELKDNPEIRKVLIDLIFFPEVLN